MKAPFMKAAVVLTSIHDCTELLNGYLANFAKYGREASIYVITDVKTPAILPPKGVIHRTLIEQASFLQSIGFPVEDIPLNSDNRRNIGYLMALADGAEMIVSIDDDNYCPEDEDFIGEHWNSVTDSQFAGYTQRWFNNCELLYPLLTQYPRGFPYFARNGKQHRGLADELLQVRINAGLWIGDPDFDAITWLSMPKQSESLHESQSVFAAEWCPINSQNTAVYRDLMPAYYFVKMTPPIDRFGDIFQGYFALKVAKHMGWTARFGSPVVTHRRNSHNYLKDAMAELPAIVMLEELLPKLIEHKLTGTMVGEAYLSLADFIESQNTPFYSETARLMRLWEAACRRIG
jgi:Reversibly glycosylated polypeptide